MLIIIMQSPERTTPEWSHAAVACMADGQPSALGTGSHPGSETSVGLPGEQELYERRSHMQSQPHSGELRTFRGETERRRHLENGRTICALTVCRCRHDMMLIKITRKVFFTNGMDTKTSLSTESQNQYIYFLRSGSDYTFNMPIVSRLDDCQF